MPNTLPTAEELEQIDSYLEHAEVKGPAARAYVIKKFAAGDVSIETLPAFIAVERIDNARALGLAPAKGGDNSGHRAPANGHGANGADNSADNTAEKNPWFLASDDPIGIQRRTEIIKSLGTKVAAQLAKAASVDLAARPLKAATVA